VEASALSASHLEQAQEKVAKTEVELRVVKQREEALRQEESPELQKCRQELVEVIKHEEELEVMLHEVQQGLLEQHESQERAAGDGGQEEDAADAAETARSI